MVFNQEKAPLCDCKTSNFAKDRFQLYATEKLPRKWRSPPSVSVTLAPSPVAAGVCSGTISAAAGGEVEFVSPRITFSGKNCTVNC